MEFIFSAKNGMGTKESGVTSCTLLFDYRDIQKFASLPEVFRLKLGESIVVSAWVSKTSPKPVAIETHGGMHRFFLQQIDTNLEGVVEVSVRVDISIAPELCGLLRVENISLSD